VFPVLVFIPRQREPGAGTIAVFKTIRRHCHIGPHWQNNCVFQLSHRSKICNFVDSQVIIALAILPPEL
jgi:hypothetical protein